MGFIPGELLPLPWLPAVEGFELEEPVLDDPVLADPVFDDPVPGMVLDAPFVVPGNVPQGEPFGMPGVFVVFGLTVEGCVVFPGVAGLELDPGALVFGVPLGEVDCPGVVCGVAVLAGGVAVLASGVAVLAGGVAVPAGGVAGEPGVELCPALLEPPAGAVPAGAAWATAQLAQHSRTHSNASFGDNMFKTSTSFELLQLPNVPPFN